MKTTTRSNIYLPMAAMILTAVLAVPAAAKDQVPFKGAMQGHDTDLSSTNTTFTVLTVGTGIGTHVGQFSFTQTVTVEFATGHDTGSAQWFAANGDSISTTITGSGQAIEPNLFSIEEVHTITGGTGRFAGAQGRSLKANEDPDRLSFLHSVRVVQRRMARYGAIPPSGQESPA